MSELSERLKSLIIEKGILQKDLAKKLKLSPQTLNLYINGKREPSIDTLKALAESLNVSVNYLINDYNNLSGKEETADHYYINDDARDLAQFMFENPEYKVLFDASRKVKKEDIEFVKQMMDRMKGTSDDTGC